MAASRHAEHATEFMLSRLVRAWYFTEFTAGSEESRIDRTAVMANLILAWWAEVDVEAVIVMADKHPMDQVPGRCWLLGYPL